MGWDRKTKSGRSYYYQAKRINGRVLKTYVGSGKTAERAAQQDLELRRRQKADREYWEHVFSQFDENRQTTDALLAWTKLLMRSALVSQGYYQHHRGEWRMRGRRSHG